MFDLKSLLGYQSVAQILKRAEQGENVLSTKPYLYMFMIKSKANVCLAIQIDARKHESTYAELVGAEIYTGKP